ncbi:putative exonuclease 1 [Phytophthora cinnamomi]|uniref:putative exonuclease 1 n=1 Tax=Phytophthora cinnamomi TaxID=4785 RepID=UPI003559BA6F|nr:putative exonuclease 1 [Phytophthora cinnamomi]
MGVTGLLPVLKSVTDQVHVSKYAGKTVGVDASGWLYKGAYSCPVDLVLGRPTDAYLNFGIQQIKLLQEHDITPILVFDGAPLPSKAQENAARARSRKEWKLKAEKLLKDKGEDRDGRAIFTACTRAVSVTNDMVMKLIAVLRRMNITFYVAPYEADAQLAFMSRQKIVDVVISDDSDCVPYGVKTALFKLSPDGWGSELKRRSLGANEELSFVGWTEEMFIQLCVLAGCDYCPSVSGVGIITAYKLVSQYKTPTEVLAALQKQKGSVLPDNFAEHYCSAILTYRHQLVFDPRDAKLKMLSPLDASKDILPRVDKGLHFLGNVELRDDVVAFIASGQINPVTHESYVWKDTAAAVLLEEERQASSKPRPKSSRTRSSTSSESSGMVLPHQRQAESSQEDPIASSRRAQASTSRVQYEKPRPSSHSSWTHLDSVLGSSDHIVNFRSPKVSENFKPLAALHEPPVSIGSSSITAHDLKDFESRPVRSHVQRVRNPANRRRDGKGSGFEGEVLCKVDSSSLTGTGVAAASSDVDRLTDEENAPPPQAKRPRLLGCPSSPPSCPSSRVSEASSQKLLVRPTPFGCGPRQPPSPTSSSAALKWKLSPRRSQQQRRPLQQAPSKAAFAVSAEEKWDRILRDELDTSSSQVDEHEDESSSSSHQRAPLAPLDSASS